MGLWQSCGKAKETERITLELLAEKINRSQYCVALTGAGVSAESGIPTFRDVNDGMWQRYDPKVYATIWGYRLYPHKIWELLRDFLTEHDPKPNDSHYALTKIQEKGRLNEIITQNVDNLHQDSGSGNVVEFHGNLMEAKCMGWWCGDITQLDRSMAKTMVDLPPKCLKCGANLKPNAILFGEGIPSKAHSLANCAVDKCDLLLVIGTSANVSPASSLPDRAMRNSHNAKVIEINIAPTGLTNRVSDYIVCTKSSELMSIVKSIKPKN